MQKSIGQYDVRKVKTRHVISQEQDKYIVEYVGPLGKLEAKRSSIGEKLTGFPAGFVIDLIEITPEKADSGRMSITLLKQTPGSGSPQASEPLGEPIFELDWIESSEPIESHPKCGHLKADRKFYANPGYATDAQSNPAFSDTSEATVPVRRRQWEEWTVLDETDYEAVGTGWSLSEYQTLKERGKHVYPVAIPQARVTRYSRSRPSTTGGVWKKSTPPAECGAPSDPEWTYVKIASMVRKEGRLYTLVEEWVGYTHVEDIFFL